jgi:hypothetical protein
MGRATFEGPVLSGDNRFGPLRNVGYAELVQGADLTLSNVTLNTAGYSGSSGQFVNANGIPNANAVVYTPSSTAYPSTAATVTADAGTAIYRGAVMYLPTGCQINDILIDCAETPTYTGSTSSSVQVLVSNGFTADGGTAAYAQIAKTAFASLAVGRLALSTFTATQLTNQQATSTDILQGNGQPNLSQVVFTISVTNSSGLAAPFTAGKYYFTVRYTQPDNNIGTSTTYPYGNFD